MATAITHIPVCISSAVFTPLEGLLLLPEELDGFVIGFFSVFFLILTTASPCLFLSDFAIAFTLISCAVSV